MELNKYTISTIFFVPTLNFPKDVLKDNEFINAYSKDEEREKEQQYENVIYLLFKPKNLDKFREFVDSEYERGLVDDYDYENGYVVLVYHLNILYNSDFQLIREGQYSKTSQEFQKLFSRVLKIIKNGLHRDELSLQYRIFNKTKDLIEYWEEKFNITFGKNQEIWTGWKDEDETLNITKIKELV